MNEEVLVIGHRNPDTDAICSAIGYAEYKRKTGMPGAVAARCGDTNDRIDFVLSTFGVEPPRFVADVAPRIRDVMQTNVFSALSGTSAAEALALMDERNLRILPILNPDGTCKGLLSVFKMSKFFFPSPKRQNASRRILSSVRRLSETLTGEMVHGVNAESEEDLILMVGAMSAESFQNRMGGYDRNRLVVVVGDRSDIQQAAVQSRVRVVVITGGFPLDPELVAEAVEHGVSMIRSPHDSATTAMLCRASISVDHVMQARFLTFRADEPLDTGRQLAADSQFQAFPVLDDRDNIVGILSKSDFLRKVNRRLILVDHNELSQAVAGAETVEILEIIDHHRIGAFTSQQPILFRNEPVGSTSTIVADCFLRDSVLMTRPIAGLLLAGLVSDTLNLTSPTTTQRDFEVRNWLEAIAGINATEFTEKLFASGSVLVSRPPDQAIATDCKEYTEKGRTFSVAQIEELGFDTFHRRKGELMEALENYRSANRYFFSALLVTDVVLQTSLLLVTGSRGFVDLIDYPEVEPGIHQLDGVVSRKKQLLPYLTHCLERVKG